MIIDKRYLSYTEKKRVRARYSKTFEFFSVPCLLDIQLNSYTTFLNSDRKDAFLRDLGLESIFRSIFPICSYTKYNMLEYLSYSFDKSFFSAEECRIRNKTFSASLKIKVRLTIYDKTYPISEYKIKNVITQDVYVCELPIMTTKGTFIINGIERVVVSQLHRSPGVLFEYNGNKFSDSEKVVYSARIIPYRGSWVDFELDYKDLIYVRIDRKRKLTATILLKSFGYTTASILRLFFDLTYVRFTVSGRVEISILLRCLYDEILETNVFKDGTVIIHKGTLVNQEHLKIFGKTAVVKMFLVEGSLIKNIIGKDIFRDGKKLLVAAGTVVNTELLNLLKKNDVRHFFIVYTSNLFAKKAIIKTLQADPKYDEKVDVRVASLLILYKTVRPNEHPTVESAITLLNQLFFDLTRYDLSDIGVMKFNLCLGNKLITKRILTVDSIVYVIKKLINIKNGYDTVDDIDHLDNRRVRSVGELIENQFRLGFTKVERTIKERLTYAEIEMLTPRDLINTKPVASAVNEFFCSNQLSQFMDQTNPLSGITHKRRISALGLGGLTRERAGFEVRDVHYTHYGRLCPVETPEGPNIGLINSLALYSKINSYGFLETPYCRVKNRRILRNEITYLPAGGEKGLVIAQSNVIVSIDGYLLNKYLLCRYGDEFKYFNSDDVDFVDVSSKQIVSVAAAMIPFLENDDANRVLMGSNMQRQAVPLLFTEKPLVGTGVERIFIQSARDVVLSESLGIVTYVDSKNIVIVKDLLLGDSFLVNDVCVYSLLKYNRTNQNTCLNQRVIVDVGLKVRKYDIIADTTATDLGDLSIGKNILVAFMSWYGYNFEDSIVISENLVRKETFTSLHIEEFICTVRDTKVGSEEITRDLPNVDSFMLRNLDNTGIVYVGAEVMEGDILVGKVTPIGETQLTPEEKLLRAIFGEKASDVKDTSLRVSSDNLYTVVDVKIYNKISTKVEAVEETDSADFIDYKKKLNINYRIKKFNLFRSLQQFLLGKKLLKCVFSFRFGYYVTQNYLKKLSKDDLFKIVLVDEEFNNKVSTYYKNYKILKKNYNVDIDEYKKLYRKCDNLTPGVLKIVKVFLAFKRRIKIGDKMSGRHGNKGVISTIVSPEDMPYLPDGTPIDMILNPLSVPSRMNIGQVLETHLGLAIKLLGQKLYNLYLDGFTRIELQFFLDTIYNLCGSVNHKRLNFSSYSDYELCDLLENLKEGIPVEASVFDSISEQNVKTLVELAGFDSSGQTFLYDGLTGNKFDKKITVGYVYMLKLNHLVDDKMHARSIGAYSLITQQPLGGKAQFGGQRFGEMEVWALEAYGAAYTLQELLTVKSDDVSGRVRVYKNIIDNDYFMVTGIPESFNVLVKEIRSLGLNIEFY